MGSTQRELPPASSPDLVLAESTPAERQHVWALHHAKWGAALTRDAYLRRETFLMTVPLANKGGVTHWILTERGAAPDARPVYASCESLRKRALASRVVAGAGVVLEEGFAHGIASVFTDPAFRGRGYASRMMAELGPTLAAWSEGRRETTTATAAAAPPPPRALFSVLYSDIGKQFYAKNGWAAFESSHLRFPPAGDEGPAPATADAAAVAAKPLGYHDLAELCDLDEQTLRKTMAQRAAALAAGGDTEPKRVCAALMPDLDQFLWHLMREDFMTTHIFGRTPTVRGALFDGGSGGGGGGSAATTTPRVWAVWTRGYYGGRATTDGNTLHILRLAVEGGDEGGAAVDEAHVAAAVRALVGLARAEARDWCARDVHLWNPSPLLRRAVARCGLPWELVARETDSIASLMWYGAEPTAAVEWVANEKFAWC